jgi:hypothetical protein
MIRLFSFKCLRADTGPDIGSHRDPIDACEWHALRLLHSLFVALGLAGTRTYSVRRTYSVLLERTATSYTNHPIV